MRWLTVFFLGWLAAPALAALNVVATTASMAVLAREVGGAALSVSVLAPSDRDPHMLQAKPSMIRALRDADLVVAVGAELEQGWLPAAIASSANPRLLPGRPGYFEAAAQVDLLDTGQAADRAHGDVHPAGNPHLHLDPLRMGRVAQALAERLGRLDATLATPARQRAQRFAETARERLPAWQARTRGTPGVLLFHKDGIYLTERLGVPVLGYLEPVPGMPPSASHLQGLRTRLQDKSGVILRHAYQPASGADSLARDLGWSVRVVALEPPVTADAAGYFGLIDQWVEAIAAAR